MSLIPAYGRDYTTLEAVTRDFNEGKDFRVPQGAYANKEDLKAMGHTSVQIRYDRQRKVVSFTL